MESTNMHRAYKMVKDAVKQCPLPLSNLTEPKLIAFANSFMPRSVGIEIECACINSNPFINIPGLMVFEPSDLEQRFRFEPGIIGMNALYTVSDLLKTHYGLNPDSGIHYHIDFTDKFDQLSNKHIPYGDAYEITELNWMLKGIKNWNYTGRYNHPVVGTDQNQIRLHQYYKTIEFRTGEMTFDYPILIKRIITASRIVEKLATSLKKT